MGKKIKIFLAILLVAAFTNGLLLLQSGLWRRAVSDDQVWENIRKNGSYEVYLEAATRHFGSRAAAEKTQVSWAVDQWKGQAGSAVVRQKFLTDGVIFELELGRGGSWRVVAVRGGE